MSDHGRVYRTDDGKHVPEGHKDAAFLAYTEHDELPKEVAAELSKSDPKARRKPADKSRAKQADKGQSNED